MARIDVRFDRRRWLRGAAAVGMSLAVPFEPHPDLPGQRIARFDIVLG